MTRKTLSIVCVTRGDDDALAFLHDMAQVAHQISAEFVPVADGHEAQARLLSIGLTATVVHSVGYVESVLDQAIMRCNERFILRLDDDERCSPAMVRWLERGDYLACDHWKFPRQHVWPEPGQVILTPHLFPDWQTRLSVKEKAGGRNAVHAGSPFGGGEEAPVAIEHHKFRKSYAARLAIAQNYDRFCKGYGTGNMRPFSLPEDVYQFVTVVDQGDGTVPWTPSWERTTTFERRDAC